MQKTSARLLSLLSLLQSRRDWPGQLLAERLEVSPRTVRRDVDRLRELGYPIVATKGPDGGYRLGAGTELPPLLFDDDQAVALTVALQTATATGAGIEEAAARALSTVRQVMPARLRHRVDALRITAVEHAGARPQPRVDPRVLMTLSAAVRAREVLRFDYTSARVGGDGPATAPPRRAQPHHLVTRGGRWYLVAWDLDREDWRTFRVDRITPRTPTGPRFTPREVPGGEVAAFVAGRFRGSDGPGDWPCRGEVILDLPAADVSPFAHDGVVEELGPDRCRLVLGAWSWPGLAATIGRFDADIEVVGPAELKDAFAHLARRYADAAGGPAEPTPPPSSR
ncbi:transcriptional regulator [Streptomyces malaysiensis subsp. malaysiensis]|uniref:helix-turn-helix transcriptional regulator n=1 Tax=Streptomyces malaysiensis TaxID=92644 RepID=UPI0024C0088A|nr:transcriptional regulator [Streptomyces sp. NA07423]WHX23292.1 transcriptional regulator [Streptomyces sp. NA07423]